MLSNILLLLSVAAYSHALPQTSTKTPTPSTTAWRTASSTDAIDWTSFPTDPAAIESFIEIAIDAELAAIPTDSAGLASFISSAEAEITAVEAELTSFLPGFPTIAAADLVQFAEAIPTSLLTATNVGCNIANGDAAWFTTLPASVQTDVASFISAGEAWFATATVDGAQEIYSSLIAPYICSSTSVAVSGKNSTTTTSKSGSTLATTTGTAKTSGTSVSSTAKVSSVSQASGAEATGGVAASLVVIVGALGLMAGL